MLLGADDAGASGLAGYEIIGTLADGASAVVYRARQRSTGQPIAVKILRDVGDSIRVVRFTREAALCARLRHPHIVSLIDAGRWSDGAPYLAFALLPGEPLAQVIAREGAIAPLEARRWMLELLDALACAHATGVVHRDLTPRNIWISGAGARRHAILLDFGAGGVVGEPVDVAVGSPGYSAPEQWRGAAPDPRADLFAWGLVFSECLTGVPVYSASAPDVLSRMLGSDAVPLPATILHHPFGALLARVVRKDAAARDVTARRLYDELEALESRAIEVAARPIAMIQADDTPLAGRRSELAQLEEQWQRAARGMGQASLIIGEPGIGKSRLTRALHDRLDGTERLVIEVRCAPHTQHSALAPIIEMLERTLGLDQAATPADRLAQLAAEVGGRGLVLADAMPVLLPLFGLPITAPYAELDVSASRRKALTLLAIIELIRAFAARQPVLAIVEDLQWADPTTMELLGHLVRVAPEAALSVVMTARPELISPFVPSVAVVPLGRLTGAEVEDMLANVVACPLPRTVTDYVIARADGVPLFVEELVRMLVDTGLVVEGLAGCRLTGPLASAAIPDSLRALIAARLDRLTGALPTAQLAAVLGREVRLDVLTASSPRTPAVVADDVAQLVAGGLMRRIRHGLDVVCTFKHALVRDAAYDSLSAADRIAAHARIARALEERFPDIVGTRPDLLAHHYSAADQARPAVSYAQRAAALDLSRSNYGEAIAHAGNAITWAPALQPDEAIEAELVANGSLIQALMAARGWTNPEIKATADRSMHLLSLLAEHSPYRVQALWSLFTYHHVASHRASARCTAEQLLAVAERAEDAGQIVAATTLLGLARFIEGDHRAARPHFARAIAMYDPAIHRDHGALFGVDSLVLARAFTAHLRWFAGDTAGAYAQIAEAIAWGRELGHVPSVALALMYGGTVYQRVGDQATVARMTGELLALSARYGLPAYEGYGAILNAWAIGDDVRIRAIVERLTQLGCQLALPYYASLAADGQAARGEFDEAIACIDKCIGLCAENDEHYYEPELHRRRARYLARRARSAEERASLIAAAALAGRLDMPRIELLARLDLARRFGEHAAHAGRLTELRTRYPDLNALAIEDTADDHETAQNLPDDLPARHRGFMGR